MKSSNKRRLFIPPRSEWLLAWVALSALAIVFLVTLLIIHQHYSVISWNNFWHAQATTPALWLVDLFPILALAWTFWLLHKQLPSKIWSDIPNASLTMNLTENNSQWQDSLTGLAARQLFDDRLNQALSLAHARQANLGVLFLDLNHYKEVNGTLGTMAADRILKQVAIRLASALKESESIGRWEDDDFVILVPDLKDFSELEECAARLHKALEGYFSLESLHLCLTAAIGIALYPTDGTDAQSLIEKARSNCLHAKKTKSMTYFSASKKDKDPASSFTHKIKSELRPAFAARNLSLYYQAKILLQDYEIYAVQVSINGEDAFNLKRTLEFVPVAERVEWIQHLTRWLLSSSLQQIANWRQEGLELPLAINLTMLETLDVDLPELLAGLLAAYNVPATTVSLELDKKAIFEGKQHILAILQQLANLGVKIALSDFDIGYFSLSYISQLPINEIKISAQTTKTLQHEDSRNIVMIRALIELAHNLNFTVIAEGVDTKNIFNALKELKCDAGQGYYLSKSELSEKMTAWLLQVRTQGGHQPAN